MVLREEAIGRVLARGKGGAIDDAPEFAATVDQGVLHRRQFLIQADLVFLQALAAHKLAFVVCLFGAAFRRKTSDFATLDSVAPNLVKRRATSINQDYRLNNLLNREFDIVM